MSLNSRARSIDHLGKSLAASDPGVRQALATISMTEEQARKIRDDISNATVSLMQCLAPYTKVAWHKMGPATRGQSTAAASFTKSLELIHQALEALLAVFESSSWLGRSVLKALLPDPRALPAFDMDGIGVVPGRCALPDCQRPLAPRSGPGRPRRYCSAPCRELDHFRRRRLQVAAEERKRLIAEASSRREQIITGAAAFANAARQQYGALLAHRDECPVPVRDSTGQGSKLPVPSHPEVLLSPEMTDRLRRWLTSLKRHADNFSGLEDQVQKNQISLPPASTESLWSSPAMLSSELRERSDIVKELASSLESAQTDLLNWRLDETERD